MADLAPPAVAALDASLRGRLRVVQQCRAEDMERVGSAYRAAGVVADLQPFFADLPARIAASHLVLSRSGASTVAELGVIGRPAIMTPLPHALDQDQLANARVLSGAGGGWVVEQSAATPQSLAADIAELIRHPDQLAAAAAAARSTGRPDAVDRLADLVEQVAGRVSTGTPLATGSDSTLPLWEGQNRASGASSVLGRGSEFSRMPSPLPETVCDGFDPPTRGGLALRLLPLLRSDPKRGALA
jgi:hypothetical protein